MDFPLWKNGTLPSINSRFVVSNFFYISSILFIDFPNSREQEIFMDKNDFTRIYPVLGPTGGVLVSCSDFQTGISFQESIPGWNTYYKNRQGKTMSMFIYIWIFTPS